MIMLVKRHRMLARYLFINIPMPGLSETFKHRNKIMLTVKCFCNCIETFAEHINKMTNI